MKPHLILGTGVLLGVALTLTATAAFPGSSIFSDVPAGHFADDAIGRMYELGIIKGRDARHFDPNGALTRAEAALLMDRLYGVMNGNAALSSSSSSSSSSWHSAIPVSSSSSSLSSSSSSVSSVPSIFFFKAYEYSGMENGGAVTITVTRSGDTSQASNVSYSTSNDSAGTADYGAAGGTLSFAGGELEKSFTVPMKDNVTIEGIRKLNVNLSSPSPGGSVGTPSTASVSIIDDETTELTDNSVFRFTSETFTASQGASAYITIRRSGSIGPASVGFATQNRTATAEGEYNSASGTVSFAIGETMKSLTVKIPSNSAAIGKTFHVHLQNPVSGSLSDMNLTTVTIAQ